jgi:hypothetical protein
MSLEIKNDNKYSRIAGLPGIIASLRSLIDQYNLELKKLRELILELARRLNENRVCEEGKISREIKKILKDKIEQGKITEKWIEECLPSEYKRKYTKSEQSSLSEQAEDKPQPEIAMTNEGKSVIMNETSNNTETYHKGSDDVNQPHNQSKQNGTGIDDNNEEGTGNADGEIAPASKQPEDAGAVRKKQVFDSHISMPFEDLRKDMEAVFRITEGVGNVWFHVILDVGTAKVTLDFCGNKQQENGAMTSTGEGRILNLAN